MADDGSQIDGRATGSKGVSSRRRSKRKIVVKQEKKEEDEERKTNLTPIQEETESTASKLEKITLQVPRVPYQPPPQFGRSDEKDWCDTHKRRKLHIHFSLECPLCKPSFAAELHALVSKHAHCCARGWGKTEILSVAFNGVKVD